MMNSVWSCSILVILSITILHEADARDSNSLDSAIDYIEKNIEISPEVLLTEPENNRASIKYALYTPNNPKEACYIEPTPDEFDICSFNPRYKAQFLIHGYIVNLLPGNMFDDLKDSLLDYSNYNIIVVDWTVYNKLSLPIVIDKAPKIGQKVAEMVHFMMNHTGVNPEKFHCIGHSMGAHICGHAARLVPHFGRVTGLDPAGISIAKWFKEDILVKHTDANFVDVIHTSFILTGTGFGLIEPIGHMDFYVNGGISQKYCKLGRKYKLVRGQVVIAKSPFSLSCCNHFIAIEYFRNSVRDDCKFLATTCRSVWSAVLNPAIKVCPTNSSIMAEMGFHSEKIPGLAPGSTFYVDTLEFPPYCKELK